MKSVIPTHKYQRNMNKNRQLKSSWCAEQLITTFKSRPHVPLVEIVDLVREIFKMIISRDFAYKVKFNAHKKLHGSMKEHYSKVMNYFKALKQSSPNTHFTIVIVLNTNPPVFQRFFVCFEGVRDGWVYGCSKVYVWMDAS